MEGALTGAVYSLGGAGPRFLPAVIGAIFHMGMKPRQAILSVAGAAVTMSLFFFATEALPAGGRAIITVIFISAILLALILGSMVVAMRSRK